ncbi:hypothetical protein [Umezawaea sp. Da 62-37]|uniref:hypothetical protein n=1 Tax=Umezawaea sp. Da 62-37 TaxID=3075927 RepID=UPI0028F6C70E|nr:hypothetical protein [Umezawaea sp. Da 62-37]WNV85335.1 hypothetical protein RM788_45670 [Umezawaea sp. Da 62-37]
MADDHLARLLFDGPVGSGRYTPTAGARVRLTGRDEVLDAIVHLHEVHHCALNDGTAWGVLLHALARVPGRPLGDFLDVARKTHETFATYSSTKTVEAHYGPSHGVLDAYPAYAPLHDGMTALLAGVQGANRKLTVVTALARVCMQSPVLEFAVDRGVDAISLADVRAVDLPDRRWARLLAGGPEMARRVAETADDATASTFGRALLDADIGGEGLNVTSAAEHDEHWRTWEIAAYDAVRHELPGTAVLDYAGHREGAAAVTALVPGLRLRGVALDEPALDDHELRAAIIQQMAHDLQEREHIPSRVVSLPVDRLVAAVAATTVINGVPHLFVDVRQSAALADEYDWTGPPPGDGPVVVVRLVDTDGAVLHRVVNTIAELHEVADEWGYRGPVVCCVTTSCLADARWRDAWLPELPGVNAVLVDVEAERFLPGWRAGGTLVRATRLSLDDPARAAVVVLVLRLEGNRHPWFAVGDRITTTLLLDQIRASLGAAFTESALPDAEVEEARAAALHLLHTESYVGFTGLEERG